MSAVAEWISERRRIHDAATGGWERDEEDGGNFWTGGGRSDFHLTPDDARSAVDAHNALPAALTAIEKVLELHQRAPLYELAVACQNQDEDHQDERHYEANDGTLICEDMPVGFSCPLCFDDYGEPIEWPCATVRAIEGAINE